MKVVILAGGLGTRLAEFTKTIPKPMVKIKNKPISYTAKIPAVISRLTYSLENLLNFISTVV